MNWLVLVLLLAGLFTLVFIAQRLGASKAREKDASQRADTSARQTKAALESPKTKEGLVERLRKGGF